MWLQTLKAVWVGWIGTLVVNPARGWQYVSDVVATSTVSYTKSTLVDMPRRLQVLLLCCSSAFAFRGVADRRARALGRPRLAPRSGLPATSPRDTARRALDDDAASADADDPFDDDAAFAAMYKAKVAESGGQLGVKASIAAQQVGRTGAKSVAKASSGATDAASGLPPWAVPAALLGVAAVSLAVLTATITPPPPSEGVPVRQSKVYESEEQYLARKRNEYKDKFEKADLERQEDSVRLRQQSTLTKEEATAKPPAPQPETVEI